MSLGQFLVTPKELTEMILRASGIREGRWFLIFNVVVGQGSGGDPKSPQTGLLITFPSFGIKREDPNLPANPDSIDASILYSSEKTVSETNFKAPLVN